ncbi:MAG: hypothetical protein HND51_14360 [Chloroflexi bacterium]|nr:hypothetical protein [Chloroflexota bacterium]
MHGLENKYGSEMQFSYIDVDDGASAEFKNALNYRYQPHLVLLDANGNILWQWIGNPPEEDLEEAIQDALFQ